MLDKDLSSLKKKVIEDRDFVYSPKDGNNIDKVLESKDKELDDKKIAKLLLLEESEVIQIYNQIIEKIRKVLTKKEF